jgi:exo-1,4-beta-D-glucosaminidase
MANIWINGKKLADQKQAAGTYSRFDFDITPFVNREGANVLAVEVTAPTPNNLAWTWVDWCPMPQDMDMGIWRDVWISRSGPVAVDYPKVITNFDLPSLDTAHLTVVASVSNVTDQSVKTVLKGTIEDIKFIQPVELKARETREIVFEPSKYPQLNISHPRIWWPYQMGNQEMYDLQLAVETDGKDSDLRRQSFGIRQATSELLEGKYRLFKFNGKPILIRGGGWANDLMFRQDPAREEKEIQYVKDMHLNTIRFEGPMGSDHLISLCDKYGILVMPGWECCCHWEHWKKWAKGDQTIANASLRSVLNQLFNHPSVYVWLNGSDIAPPDSVLGEYLRIEKEERWPNPCVAAASVGQWQDETKTLEGPTGVKMSGPYQYVPPSYWYVDTKNGGGFGYNTETSVGPAVPVMESLKKMIPPEHLQLGDEYLSFHCTRGSFSNLDTFDKGFESRFGKATDLEDYTRKAQLMVYDGHRAMYEAYEKNKYHSATGVIQWMLNNSWPSFYWHLYDYYLQPAGSYFGAKKANEPLHVQYSYDDGSVILVNNLYKPFEKLKVRAKVYQFDLTEKFSKEAVLDAPEDSSTAAFTIPSLEDLSTTYFVKLDLEDSMGKLLNTNFYCLSTKKEKLDWDKTEYDKTPVLEDADMKMLNQLPKVKVKLSSRSQSSGETGVTRVSVANPGKNLAFFIRLKLVRNTDKEEVLPVLWEDNYVTLMPGEKRELQVTYQLKDLNGAKPVVEAEGWNVEKGTAKKLK